MSKPPEIKGYVCPRCHWVDFLSTKTCPRCRCEMSETAFQGRGKITTFTVIRYPPEGFEQEAPYVVALIDLDDGPRVIGRVDGRPELLQAGTPVTSTGYMNGALLFKA